MDENNIVIAKNIYYYESPPSILKIGRGYKTFSRGKVISPDDYPFLWCALSFLKIDNLQHVNITITNHKNIIRYTIDNEKYDYNIIQCFGYIIKEHLKSHIVNLKIDTIIGTPRSAEKSLGEYILVGPPMCNHISNTVDIMTKGLAYIYKCRRGIIDYKNVNPPFEAFHVGSILLCYEDETDRWRTYTLLKQLFQLSSDYYVNYFTDDFIKSQMKPRMATTQSQPQSSHTDTGEPININQQLLQQVNELRQQQQLLLSHQSAPTTHTDSPPKKYECQICCDDTQDDFGAGPCGHTYCVRCLMALPEDYQHKSKCPTCRSLFTKDEIHRVYL